MGRYQCSTAVMTASLYQAIYENKYGDGEEYRGFTDIYEEQVKGRLQIASRLKDAREAAGISLGRMAFYAGVSEPYLWNIEHGKTLPSVSVLVAYCCCINNEVTEENIIFPNDILGIGPIDTNPGRYNNIPEKK